MKPDSTIPSDRDHHDEAVPLRGDQRCGAESQREPEQHVAIEAEDHSGQRHRHHRPAEAPLPGWPPENAASGEGGDDVDRGESRWAYSQEPGLVEVSDDVRSWGAIRNSRVAGPTIT